MNNSTETARTSTFPFNPGDRVQVQDIGAAIFRRWDGALAVVCVEDPHAADPESYPSDLDIGMTGVITVDPYLLAVDDADGFVRLNSNPEHTQRRTLVVTNESGCRFRFCARLVMPGDRYGAVGHNVGQRNLQPLELVKINEGREPLIEWYAETAVAGFTPLGQHTGGIYHVKTMADHYWNKGEADDDVRRGLNLEGSIPEWSVDAAAFDRAYRVLVLEQGLDPYAVQGRDGKWRAVETVHRGEHLPWIREEVDGRVLAFRASILDRVLRDLEYFENAKAEKFGPGWCDDDTVADLDELSKVDKAKVANLARWGLVFRDHTLYGHAVVRLSLLGRLWYRCARARQDFCGLVGDAEWSDLPDWNDASAAMHWIDTMIEEMREEVIDAMDEQTGVTTCTVAGDRDLATAEFHRLATFTARKLNLDNAKAFRGYLVARYAAAGK